MQYEPFMKMKIHHCFILDRLCYKGSPAGESHTS
ncbi:MAG: hypothetical protein UY97_C0015G0015 [Parcubacteria group bacterium GW2011_GWB1_57_6]|nr:MAG: hypothetical protein UY93_C0003G0025 [Parcubacteria group bacterium GW2011_GWA1_56_13]KKW45788.1 MAG: hypothetical protein UY97_C0015G0015 [Parcubacteria group bacterium GW2011_GWB1_57_6]